MKLLPWSAERLSKDKLPGKSVLIRMADRQEMLVEPFDKDNVVDKLDLIFHDSSDSYLDKVTDAIHAPDEKHAKSIVEFVNAHQDAACLVAQCQAGIGRSHAVVAAVAEMRGTKLTAVFRQGTYNRKLYRLLLLAAGRAIPEEPLVSLSVRLKYPIDRTKAFLLCMERQRYENWEVVAVTDGYHKSANCLHNDKLRIIHTKETLGKWGHPHRQEGLEACKGKYVGTANDDDYYCPGYLEQMVFALQDSGAGIAFCQSIHKYSGWSVVQAGTDLGCWLAKADLVRQVKWDGDAFDYDRTYIQKLLDLAGGKAAVIHKPLHVKN